jgi:drug/metabolite transporter (DMT)-like permease
MFSKKAGVYVAILGAMVCWSFSFIWVKVAYLAYGPLTTVLFRLIIAAGFMLLYSKISRQLMKIKPADYLTFLLLAFFEPFLYFMGESYGLKYISSTMAAIIISTIPLFSPLAAYKFHGESVSIRNFVGIIISFLGVSLVVFDDSFQFTDPPLGMALEFLAVAAAIGYTTVLAGLAKKYNTPTIVSFQNFIAIFYFLPIWLFLEGKDLLITPFNATAFGAIIKLGIFASVMAFVLFTYSLRNMGINRSNMFINGIPVITALLAWYILGDPMNWRKMTGIFIVIVGLFLSQVKMNKKVAELISIQEDAGR